MAYWSGALHGGTSLDAIAGGFLASAEFQARYGNPDNGVFVADLYQNVLHREGDASGLAYWQGVLDNGTATRTQALVGFSESAENEGHAAERRRPAAARLYLAALGRAPNSAGLTFWTSQLSNGTATLAQEADALAGSPEFISHYGSLDNAGFVGQLYLNVLGRAADAAGLAAWISALANGASRGARGDRLQRERRSPGTVRVRGRAERHPGFLRPGAGPSDRRRRRRPGRRRRRPPSQNRPPHLSGARIGDFGAGRRK